MLQVIGTWNDMKDNSASDTCCFYTPDQLMTPCLQRAAGKKKHVISPQAEWTTVEAAKQRRMVKRSHGLTEDDMDKLREETGTAETEEMRKCDEAN